MFYFTQRTTCKKENRDFPVCILYINPEVRDKSGKRKT